MSSLTPDDAAYEVVEAPPVLSVELIEQAEAALTRLSNALYDTFHEQTGDKSNYYWADAAVDRAMRDLNHIRTWLEG